MQSLKSTFLFCNKTLPTSFFVAKLTMGVWCLLLLNGMPLIWLCTYRQIGISLND